MRSDKAPSAGMSSRQKITIAVFVVVFLIVVWLVWGMFHSPSPEPAATATRPRTMSANAPGSGVSKPAQTALPGEPQQAQLMASTNTNPTSPEVMAAKAQEQELQAKYVEALNELQMLKIQRDIAQANQAIMAAKLATVTAQKSIVNLVNPPVPIIPPPNLKTLGSAPRASGASGAPGTPDAAGTVDQKDITYQVVSVSQVQYRWSAVLSYQGTLYHVQVGDTIPADNSTVVSITRSGVVLAKDGVRKKLSLVTAI